MNSLRNLYEATDKCLYVLSSVEQHEDLSRLLLSISKFPIVKFRETHDSFVDKLSVDGGVLDSWCKLIPHFVSHLEKEMFTEDEFNEITQHIFSLHYQISNDLKVMFQNVPSNGVSSLLLLLIMLRFGTMDGEING